MIVPGWPGLSLLVKFRPVQGYIYLDKKTAAAGSTYEHSARSWQLVMNGIDAIMEAMMMFATTLNTRFLWSARLADITTVM